MRFSVSCMMRRVSDSPAATVANTKRYGGPRLHLLWYGTSYDAADTAPPSMLGYRQAHVVPEYSDEGLDGVTYLKLFAV